MTDHETLVPFMHGTDLYYLRTFSRSGLDSVTVLDSRRDRIWPRSTPPRNTGWRTLDGPDDLDAVLRTASEIRGAKPGYRVIHTRGEATYTWPVMDEATGLLFMRTCADEFLRGYTGPVPRTRCGDGPDGPSVVIELADGTPSGNWPRWRVVPAREDVP